jgi:hypothetical protein
VRSFGSRQRASAGPTYGRTGVSTDTGPSATESTPSHFVAKSGTARSQVITSRGTSVVAQELQLVDSRAIEGVLFAAGGDPSTTEVLDEP